MASAKLRKTFCFDLIGEGVPGSLARELLAAWRKSWVRMSRGRFGK